MGSMNGAIDAVARAAVALRAMLNGSASEDFSVKKLTAADTITPHTTKGIVGTVLANDAQSGSLGEIISSEVLSTSPVALTSGVIKDITSILLTPGDWDVTGGIAFSSDYGVTTATDFSGSVLHSVGIVASRGFTLRNKGTIDGIAGGSIMPRRYSVSINTTVYLNAHSNFAVSTMSAYGFIRARRIR